MPFLSFKGTTHAYLLKISITHDENRTHLLHLLINCIAATAAPQVLVLSIQLTFLKFSNNWFV